MRYEKNALQKEIEAPTLLKTTPSVPVPEVLFCDSTKTLYDSSYFFMEKLNDTNYHLLSDQLSTEQNHAIMFQAGKLNRQINNIEVKTFGDLIQSGYQDESLAATFNHLVSDVLCDATDLGIDLPVSCRTHHKVVFLCM